MTKQANIKTAPEVEAAVENAYRAPPHGKGLGYNETAYFLGLSSTTVRRIVRDCPGLARTRMEQLVLTMARKRMAKKDEHNLSLNGLGLKTAAPKCKGCKMDFVTPISDDSVKACPLCVYAEKQRRAGDTRPLFWGLRP